MHNLCTATGQPLQMEGMILPPSHLGTLFASVWFYVTPKLAGYILLKIWSIDSSFRGIFPSRKGVLPWPSQLVAKLNLIKSLPATQPDNCNGQPTYQGSQNINNKVKDTPVPILMARQILLQSHTGCRVMIIISAFGIYTVKPKILRKILQLSFAALGMIDLLSSQQSHIIVPNFSA